MCVNWLYLLIRFSCVWMLLVCLFVYFLLYLFIYVYFFCYFLFSFFKSARVLKRIFFTVYLHFMNSKSIFIIYIRQQLKNSVRFFIRVFLFACVSVVFTLMLLLLGFAYAFFFYFNMLNRYYNFNKVKS